MLMQILTLHEISIVKLRISTPYSIPHYYSNMCPMNGQYFPFSIRALKETCDQVLVRKIFKANYSYTTLATKPILVKCLENSMKAGT